MRKFPYLIAAIILIAPFKSEACTNVIISNAASADGSNIVSYAADSHWLYGSLYFKKGGRHKAGQMRQIVEWDSFRPLGKIPEASRTWQRVGNMNEKQLIVAETTWGGRMELMDTLGVMDYGSLIYVALERASSAREAIDVIVNLANEYGYPSEGETFSIADKNEAWVMDLIGKGSEGNKGIVWVARRIPDGFICGHANQARITRFPLNDPENCLYAPDVISFARSRGWFNGPDEQFSFREAYCPLDAGTVRGCDARVWSAFNILCDGVFTYIDETGYEVSRPASDWLHYAMGYDLAGELPLFVKPTRKISAKNVADVMRDHFEGTPMDMTLDCGAGGNALPYRWRPMEFEWGSHVYCNERAIATQQTGWWMVAQARPNLPDEIGALLWFGTDDAATSYVTPIYVSTKKVPECLCESNGSLLEYSPTSQFWLCNRVTNACYKMYNQMAPLVRKAVDEFENTQMERLVPENDARMLKVKGLFKNWRLRRLATKYSVGTAQKQFGVWKTLEEMLLVKFIDGNVKAQDEDGNFLHSKYDNGTPEGLTQPGYTDEWKAAVASDPHAEVLRMK